MSDANRHERLLQYGDGATLRGLDEGLRYLRQETIEIDSDQDKQVIAKLIARSAAEMEVGVMAFIHGHTSTLFHAMRATMELEFLLRDFLANPAHVAEWRSSSERERWKKFTPKSLRERHRKWRLSYVASVGLDASDLWEEQDYKSHSELLHVHPSMNQFVTTSVDEQSGIPHWRKMLAELTEHMRRLINVSHRHRAMVPLEIDLDESNGPPVPLFLDAYQRAQSANSFWHSLSKSVAEMGQE